MRGNAGSLSNGVTGKNNSRLVLTLGFRGVTLSTPLTENAEDSSA